MPRAHGAPELAGKETFRFAADAGVADAQGVGKGEEVGQMWVRACRVDGCGMERLERAAPNLAVRRRPDWRQFAVARNVGGEGLGGPRRRDAGNDRSERSRRDIPERVDQELLQIRSVDVVPVREIQAGGPGPIKGSLHLRMWDSELVRQFPVGKRAVVVCDHSEEHIDVSGADHDPNRIAYRYAIQGEAADPIQAEQVDTANDPLGINAIFA